MRPLKPCRLEDRLQRAETAPTPPKRLGTVPAVHVGRVRPIILGPFCGSGPVLHSSPSARARSLPCESGRYSCLPHWSQAGCRRTTAPERLDHRARKSHFASGPLLGASGEAAVLTAPS